MESNIEKLDHQCFFDDSFNVDTYLSTHMQKFDLSSLRKELKKYGTHLHNETINILKTETKSIVQFAEHLSSLNSKVNGLSQPILQFREEIRSLHTIISTMQENYRHISKNLQKSDREQALIKLKIGILTSIAYIKCIMHYTDISKEDLTVLEWVVNEYSYQILFLKELGLSYSDFDSYVVDTEKKLKEFLNKIFLKAFQDKDEKILLRCLRLYVSSLQQSESEEVIREQAVKPVLKNIFSQENFDSHFQNLNALYTQALSFLHNEIVILNGIIGQNPELSGFNFVFNSFWIEVDKQLTEGLSNITAPGNPQLFQRRFQDSWNFLQEVIKHDPCSEKTRIHYYQAHTKRFNLPVYFEICYQQIGAKLEESILVDPLSSDIYTEPSESNRLFILKPSNALWDCLNLCFKEDIFLEHLSDQFVRLSMLLLSRYLKWLQDTVQNETSDKLEFFFINVLSDLVNLEHRIGTSDALATDRNLYSILPVKLKPLVTKIFKINAAKLQQLQKEIKNKIIYQRIQAVLTYLQQVMSIPRIYRRTNRSIPKEPSTYVIELINDVSNFHERYCKIVDAIVNEILDSVVTEITEKYVNLIADVMNSVSKTEKSLRRLKNRSINSTDELFNQGSSESISDETKIKVQIKLDVDYYVKKVQTFPLNRSSSVLQSLSQQINF